MAARGGPAPRLSRREALGAIAGASGLVSAGGLWPRAAGRPRLGVAGAHDLGGWLGVGEDGTVTLAVPALEQGQGIGTALGQVMADALGADWRTIALVPAWPHPALANPHLGPDWLAEPAASGLPALDAARAIVAGGGGTSVRAFAAPVRHAAHQARAMLLQAAASRADMPWQALETAEGFVIRPGADGRAGARWPFGQLAAAAARMPVPDDPPPRRVDPAARPAARPAAPAVPAPHRLEDPPRLDGSLPFVADIRLADMVHGWVAEAPLPTGRVAFHDAAAARAVPGQVALRLDGAAFIAIARDSWAARRMLDAAKVRFATPGSPPDPVAALAAAERALPRAPDPPERAPAGGRIVARRYALSALPAHAPAPASALAQPLPDGGVRVFAPVLAPAAARGAIAAALGLPVGVVVVQQTPAPGLHDGDALDTRLAVQTARAALALGRPVLLTRAAATDRAQGAWRPPYAAAARVKLDRAGAVADWRVDIAGPPIARHLSDALRGPLPPGLAPAPDAPDRALQAALVPPYAPGAEPTHHPAPVPGRWSRPRGGDALAACFITETLADACAAAAGEDPLGWRIARLGADPRLARCLLDATQAAGWRGGEAGSGQGLACLALGDARIALVAEVALAPDGAVRVLALTAAVDAGRLLHPPSVPALVEGGLMAGLAAALTAPLGDGPAGDGPAVAGPPLTMAYAPPIRLVFPPTAAPPGGVSQLGVPVVAPAIANALATLTGPGTAALTLPLGRAAPVAPSPGVLTGAG